MNHIASKTVFQPMPQSPEAEIAVLAALLRDPSQTLDFCLQCLTDNYFHQPNHRIMVFFPKWTRFEDDAVN